MRSRPQNFCSPSQAQVQEQVAGPNQEEPQPEAPRDLEFSVTDATVTEGQVAVFTVSYTGDTLAPGQTATIHVATGPGFTGTFTDATPGSDYDPVGIDLTFTGGQPTTLTVGVTTIDDTIVEGPEDYTLVLSAPSQGTIVHSPDDDVIVDNNDASNLHWSIVADSTVTEGSTATYTVGYTGAPLATGITETITVATGNGWTSGFSDATLGRRLHGGQHGPHLHRRRGRRRRRSAWGPSTTRSSKGRRIIRSRSAALPAARSFSRRPMTSFSTTTTARD